ncbi:LysR family transcriptional regulator [Hoeflea poritis]|uniref:LysR family transcriptional regulator n=1 Tax=Hoeflea poritis TaxID=2993659 RepID=A0ABT4VVH2_9HYPH|nr:LysR family transcriptional regulator [Hoeflea poritis]MDA4848710.1 LysR family transcriptional regulator [Hoeflea poritis]
MERSHRYFLMVAQCGSVTRASEELNVAQPSLTRLIFKLEDELGVTLFERLPRGMKLTPAGTTLYKHLREIDASYGRALRDIRAHRDGAHERIRIGAGLAYRVALIPQLLDAIRAKYPRLTHTVITGSTEFLAQQLADGNLDIAISASARFTAEPAVKVHELGQIEHGVAHLPGTFPDIAMDQHVALSDLADKEWITFLLDENLTESFNELFFHHKLPLPRVVLNTNSIQLGLSVQRERNAIMAVPTLLKPTLAKEGVLVNPTSEPLWRYASGIAVLRASEQHGIIRRVADIAIELGERMDLS